MVRSNKYLVLALGALTMFGAGCSGGSNPGDDGSSGHDATSEGGGDSGGPAMTYTYVINALTIDPVEADPNNPAMPHTGFNLDNLCSTSMSQFSCSFGDSTSAIDPDQNTMGCTDPSGSCKCVDNQFPTIAELLMSFVDVRQTLTDEVNNNKLALLVRVSGVNDLMNDDSVTVAVYQAFPTFTSNCNAVPTDGEYSVAMSSLNTANVDDPKVHFMGKIVNGRLEVTSGVNDQFTLPLPPIMGQTITLNLHATQIRASINADTGTTGNLGGFIVGSDLVTTVCAIQPSFCSVVTSVVGPQMDIDYPFPPTDDSSGCYVSADMDPNHMGRGALSAGLGFTLVKAHISTTTPVAASQASGTCGASGSADGG